MRLPPTVGHSLAQFGRDSGEDLTPLAWRGDSRPAACSRLKVGCPPNGRGVFVDEENLVAPAVSKAKLWHYGARAVIGGEYSVSAVANDKPARAKGHGRRWVVPNPPYGRHTVAAKFKADFTVEGFRNAATRDAA